MKTMKAFVASAVAAFFVSTASVSAAVVEYTLNDHPFGAKTCGNVAAGADCFDYGLRLDDIGMMFTMQEGNATISYDNVAGGTATISGQINQSIAGTSGTSAPSLGGQWNVYYEIASISLDNDPDGIGFTSTDITSIGAIWNDTYVYWFSGKQKMDGDQLGAATEFLFDGHRLPGDDATAVLRGWVTDAGCNSVAPSGYGGEFNFSALQCLGDGERRGTNDFLNPASEVPLPAAGWMLIAGLGGLVAARRRRHAA